MMSDGGKAELVAELRELLGAKMVAYLGELQSTRLVQEWAEGTRTVDDERVIERFHTACLAARLIAGRDGIRVAQTWFQGLNPILGDQSPALLIREGDINEVGPKVVSAARQFLSA